jgi:hypothetical protein
MSRKDLLEMLAMIIPHLPGRQHGLRGAELRYFDGSCRSAKIVRAAQRIGDGCHRIMTVTAPVPVAPSALSTGRGEIRKAA